MPKSMLEKLTEHYDTMKGLYGDGIVGGHVVGFYREIDEIIQGSYEIPDGRFTIRSVSSDNFFYWNYDLVAEKEIRKKIYERAWDIVRRISTRYFKI